MSKLTRRGLLGAAATGAVSLAACAAPEQSNDTAASAYDGDVSFDHGVASGDPMSDRVILWTRVTPKSGTGAIPVKYTVSRDGVTVAEGTLNATESRDFCVKVDVTGLEPGTAYTYAFAAVTAAGEVESPAGRTRTTAASGTAPVKLIAISCSNWQFGYFNAYKSISEEADIDAIVHLGDYFYEYGIDGYGAETAQETGRLHDPVTETVTLDDYRTRHAQYKTDPNLQAAHASAPWICTWDDHESTNNSYRTGAQNHNPEENEGDWSDRKQAAIQAYFEWMPIREPAGDITSVVWRSFSFGDVATVHALESRLTGRSPDISWFDALAGLEEPAEIVMAVGETMTKINDPARTILGSEQEAWLAEELKKSVTAGKPWQVLANQVVMARFKLPNLAEKLSDERKAAQESGYVQMMIPFSQIGAPMNPDAWDGFPAARDRLYAAASEAKARLVTLAGDTHTAWANTLQDKDGNRRGVEFGCTSITSPGMGAYLTDMPEFGEWVAEANDEVEWHDPNGNGYVVVTLTADAVRADYHKVSSILSSEYEKHVEASFGTTLEGESMTALTRV